MSNLLQVQKAHKSYGARSLFQDASFAINEGEHLGVIGPNGAGKTTLFRILTGEERLDEGELITSQGLRIGYLAQHDAWAPGATVEDYLSDGCITPIWELKAFGKGLGLDEKIFGTAIASLSGGYRMRCKLLHLIGEEPDLLLLDEPTNYLDLESLIVLEAFLQDYKGAFMMISHDREFLRRTTDHILEVEAGDITKFNGNLDDYFEQKNLLRTQLEARALSLEEKKSEIMDFVNRFGAKATKAKQAQSKLKTLEKMETIEIKALPQAARIKLPEPVHTGKNIVALEDVDLGYGQRKVLSELNFNISRGDHLAVVGVNGAGKSTFLKALAGRLEPLDGKIEYGYGVSIGYYAQHVSEELKDSDTVVDALGLKAHPDITRADILNLAGSLLFSNKDVEKPISVLSGGEKSRVALGQILLQRAPFLILDEPTNHLDFQTVEALTLALTDYKGTVIVVSHDRSFIRRIGKQILEIRNGSAEFYPGTYEEYVWSLQKGMLSDRDHRESPQAHQPTGKDSSSSSTKQNFKEQKKQLQKQLRSLQKEVREVNLRLEKNNRRMTELNELLSSQPDSPKSQAWIEELGHLQPELERDEEAWLELESQREEAEENLDQLK